MTRILYAMLGNESAEPGTAFGALGMPTERLALSLTEGSISMLRDAVEAAPGQVSAFVLAIGNDLPGPNLDGADWQRQVLLPLRQAFALLTGAARRFRHEKAGAIVVIVPSAAIGRQNIATPLLVLLRAVVGMTEALRAELQGGPRVSLLFVDRSRADDNDSLGSRLAALLASGAMYSLSEDITAERIDAYFAPVLNAIDKTTAGPPLPDIGPMGAVYDLVAAGTPDKPLSR